MLTPKISGIFDCRAYDQSGKLKHDQRKMLADTDNVTFSALIPINEVPDMFKQNGQLDELAKPKASKKERESAVTEGREPVADVVSVKFKIGSNAKWFDKYAKPCSRPTNADLEANRYNVQIVFNRKAKDPSNPLKPSGYWVNAIMISQVEANPFSGQAFEESDDTDNEPNDGAMPGQLKTPSAAAPTTNSHEADAKSDDLPF